MEIQEVKLGQKVKIARAALFYGWNVDKVGTVTQIDGEYVTVKLDGDEEDYGYASGLELIVEAPVAAATIKAAIVDVEKALAALKALVG